ncbi:MAG: DUF2726 domain-containing protein [Mariprofundaceae bacterium]|nr:DUF2726 domain-containing protein [Mariprofundaceae bacterium]
MMFWNKKKIQAEKYEPEKSVLSKEMTLAFHALKRVVRRDYLVLPNVPMARVVRPFGQAQKDSQRRSLYKALAGYNADFVICTGDKLTPIGVIMIGEGGREVEPIFEHIGTRFIRIPTKGAANTDYLHSVLEAFVAKNDDSPKTLSDTQTVLPRKYCSKCRSEMIVKRARGGPWEGSLFWVCSRFPKCKTSELHKV